MVYWLVIKYVQPYVEKLNLPEKNTIHLHS